MIEETPAPRASEPPTTSRLERLDAFVFGPPAPTDLPERARADVERAQHSAELLLTLVQAAAIISLAIVYIITPKAFPEDAPFEPVPILLTFYSVFTLLRLSMALGGGLGPRMRYLSIAVDMAVLTLTIWSFHLQYDAPPSVYLKAPTLLYVFVFIALRAMRMEAEPVLFSGFCALLGYGALTAYALDQSGMKMITNDWVVYMTSDAILVGAEVDKLLAISTVTLILAITVTRARRMLLRAAAERHAAEELSRFFPPQVAHAIRAADLAQDPMATRREAAVMMVDLRGFSSLAATLSPRETLRLISEYQALVVTIIHKHGGSIDKYLGDGVLATFGAIEERENFAICAFEAINEILVRGAAWEERRRYEGEPAPRIVAALDVGMLTLGVVGADGRLEFTIIGNAVNRVSKLEKHTRALGARGIASARALRRAWPEGAPAKLRATARPGVQIPGLSRPLDLYVIDPAGVASAP